MYDTISIGSATLDIFLKSSQFWTVPLEDGYMLCERFNEKLDVEQAEISSGGGATNTAVGFARQGFRATCISEIGTDFSGTIVMQDLLREGVDVSMMISEKSETTAISVLLIAERGERTALVFRGAARMLTVEDIAWEKVQAKWIHLSSIGNAAVVEKVMAHCVSNSMKLSWNPGMWELRAMREKKLSPNWNAVDVLFVNKEEMAFLAGVESPRIDLSSPLPVDWKLPNMPRVVVVTDGPKGGSICVDGACSLFEAAPLEHEQVVQQTGAGDAFACGFVGARLMGRDVAACVQAGVQNSASVVQQIGAKKGLRGR